MENLNSFEQLLNYPEENGLIYETYLDEKRLYLSPNNPLVNTKYIVFKKRNLIFCAYDSFTTKIGSSRTFTGIYCPIRLNPEMELKLSRNIGRITSCYSINEKREQMSLIGISPSPPQTNGTSKVS